MTTKAGDLSEGGLGFAKNCALDHTASGNDTSGLSSRSGEQGLSGKHSAWVLSRGRGTCQFFIDDPRESFEGLSSRQGPSVDEKSRRASDSKTRTLVNIFL